jgi:alpha-galactosidase
MLTDKPEVYQTDIVEAAKRTIPILFTRPGQVYEVDPTRIANLDKANSEVSGGGPRSFDADQLEYCHLYLQEISKPFENWVVLGRTGGGSENEIRYDEIGDSKDKEHLVFEFWTKTFMGVTKEKLIFPPIDSTYKCQLFCIREMQGHPQVLATNRHISCGGYDLENVEWSNNALSGRSLLTGNDRYDIYIYEPEGFAFKEFTCDGAQVSGNRKDGDVRIVSLTRNASGSVTWRAAYKF